MSFETSDESSSSQDSCELRKQKTLLVNPTKETFEKQLTEKEETQCDLLSAKEELVTIAFWKPGPHGFHCAHEIQVSDVVRKSHTSEGIQM
jgi:hypothetical protein